MANTTDVYENASASINHKISESIIPPILQFSLGVIGNIIALLFLKYTSKRHKWRPFYRLVGALAITDLSGVIFTYPAVFLRYSSDFTYEYSPQLCAYFSFCFSFAFLSSAFIVCAMSFDRYIAIIYPIVYHTKSNVRRTNIILVSTWLVSACICLLPVIGVGTAKLYYPGSWCFFNFASKDTKDRINTYIYSVTGVIVLVSTVTVNVIVIATLCRNSLRGDIETNINKKNDIAVIIILLVFVIVFGVCWTPLMIRMLINACSANPKNGPEELLAVRFTITNGIIDPWIYILLRKENILAVFKLCPNLGKQLKWVNAESQMNDSSASNDLSMKSKYNDRNTGSLTNISRISDTSYL